ncbi:MAG: hypothetical protein KA941_07055 [Flavobacteriales bacterium]|nr:hypothetical protein [Flavobacteriales bacterium]
MGDSTTSRTSDRMVVFCQHALADPLVAPLMLDYVLRLQERAPHRRVLFITEEPPSAPSTDDLLERLDNARITWMPLRYDVRKRQWWQRIVNMLRMLAAARKFVRHHPRTWMVGYLSYGGTYAIIAQILGLGPCMVVCFEPHSRYMVDLGMWRAGSIRTRVVSAFERWQMRWAKAMIVPTRAVQALALEQRPRGEVVLHGITIDVRSALFDAEARRRIRDEHALGDAITFVYVGKFGGIYHSVDAYIRFAQQLVEVDPTFRFLVITQTAEIDRIRAHNAYPALQRYLVLQPPVPPAILHQYLSAGDLGVVAIPPTPSQVFRTPVKSAHYWAAGLPLVIPAGVSDDADIAAIEGVGIVVPDIPVRDPASFVREVRSLLATDRGGLRERCAAIALKYRDTSTMVNELDRLLS